MKALGTHCEKIRKKLGYSIDRLSKESDQLSSSVIHRLEQGASPVSVTNLYRYAKALGVHPKELLDFPLDISTASPRPRKINVLPLDHPSIKKEAFKKLLPLYSLKAAAGYFGKEQNVEPEGWVEIPGSRKLDKKMFIVQAKGRSMEPKINDGDYLVFRADPSGSRQRKIVLAQYRGPADPETGGSYTVKEYHSSKIQTSDQSWTHQEIRLVPLNPEFEPIVIHSKDAQDFKILGEYLFAL